MIVDHFGKELRRRAGFVGGFETERERACATPLVALCGFALPVTGELETSDDQASGSAPAALASASVSPSVVSANNTKTR